MNIKTSWQGSAATASIFSFVPGFLIAGGVLFFALVQADFSLALPAAGVLLVSFAARVWIRLASARISFAMKPDRERLFPGERLELEIELANNKFLPVWVTLELPSPRHLETEGSQEEEVLRSGLRLLSWETRRRVWSLAAKRRGVSALGPALVSAGDLLGLGTRTKTCAWPREIIVFPRRLRMLSLSLPFQEYFGMHAARGPVEDPAWYAGTRDYSGTRPAKNIHWKASARLGVLQEKLYEPTYHRKVLFVFDAESYTALPAKEGEAVPEASREESTRDFERMLEVLGTLAAALMETGAAFGLVSDALCPRQTGMPDAAVLSAGRGPEHLGVFLEMLARMEVPVYGFKTAPRPSRFSAALREAAQAYTGLVYCGASPGEGAREAAREAGRRKKILFVFSRGAESFFEDRPACRAEDICFAEEAQ
ncbi:MAG: DUF58 domain-containing protein [Spirochaetaceae bacterium]|nr:DUF58 domain-containing protein [Spirochaetaceae bacterium]